MVRDSGGAKKYLTLTLRAKSNYDLLRLWGGIYSQLCECEGVVG